MENPGLILFLGFMAGLVIGALYFGGLWVTVSRVGRSRRPHLLLGLSFLLRLMGALWAFSLLLRFEWYGMAAAVGGFLAARRLWFRSRGYGSVLTAGGER